MLRPANGVIVRFTAGYGETAEEVPERVVQAIKLLVGHMYENRESTAEDHLFIPFSAEESEWFYGDRKVIVLGVQSEGALRHVVDRAEMQGLNVHTLSRRTEDEKEGFDSSLICAAIGQIGRAHV